MIRSRRSVRLGLAACLSLLFVTGGLRAQDVPFQRKEDVIYGRKPGLALTLDVIRPWGKGNGVGLIWVVSGGWYSSHEAINPAFVKPFVDRGYTVFAVVHGSQPKYTIPEILQDMHRAVRFIRSNASQYNVDPDRLGIFGASAGGHLSLMQGLAPAPEQPDAKDPVDRVSSKVQAVACFFPPTDFLNYGKPGENALGRGTLEGFQAPFDFHELDPKSKKYVPITDEERRNEIGKTISPVYQVSADDVPTLIIHGDADKLVPIQQAELVVEALKKAGVEASLVPKPGAQHGWAGLDKDLEAFADWFDAHLKPKKAGDDAKPEAKEAEKAAPAPPAEAAPRTTARADRLPRKVVVGTALFGPNRAKADLAARIAELTGLVEEMAREADRSYPGQGLDLAILPETVVNVATGRASERALPLDGPVKDAFGGLARRLGTYLLVPLDLAETGPDGPFVSNAAVLFDRSGAVAGTYRKAHPVAYVNHDDLEDGIIPGREYPVFDCDFGKLGVQICWDVQFDEGWKTLADRGAELVAWSTASPATVLPASHAVRHRYYVVSSAWRDNATVYEPTGMVAARIESPKQVLVHQLDLSHAILGWSGFLNNGKALTERYGDRVGYHYSTREDVGLFWSNDPATSIGEMVRAIGGEELDFQVARNRRLYERGAAPVSR